MPLIRIETMNTTQDIAIDIFDACRLKLSQFPRLRVEEQDEPSTAVTIRHHANPVVTDISNTHITMTSFVGRGVKGATIRDQRNIRLTFTGPVVLRSIPKKALSAMLP